MENLKRTFGDRLKQERKKLDMRQEDLAKKLGMTTATVRNWEQGRTWPEMPDFIRLCALFQCDADYLVGRIEQKTHNLSFLCAETGLTPEALQSLADIKSGPAGGEDMVLVSIILSSAKFKNILRSVKDAKWAGDEVHEMARSAFGLSKKDNPIDRLNNYQALDGEIRMLRAFRFEVSEAAASILNEYTGVDEMLMWIQNRKANFDLEALERAADDEMEKEANNEH